ncbi:SDR family NAD(P)-dependent oxidoreductase [Tissierella praeacuta]|uniref:SDR family NAD(P)-dependent oxidoreductase n=1 Tax=Tissierella praeacuta TaxID=43131 RepID=UPI002FD9FA6E
MKDFKGKVAVITGAAHGIGHALAKEAAMKGMNLVLADIDYDYLKKVEEEVAEIGAEVLSIKVDVTEFEQVKALGDKTIERFGKVDLFFNNAGVVVSGYVWDLPIEDIDYIIQSNIYSVLYGMKVFIPIMMKQDKECYIVNTASAAGLLTTPNMPTYHMTKHANVALSESVNYQLQKIGSKIKMSVFCPGYIQTDLDNCDLRRPERFKIDNNEPYYSSAEYKAGLERAHFVIRTGIPIDSVGMSVFKAIEEEQFYILTHPKYNQIIGGRVKTILDGKNPDVFSFLK